MLNANWWAKCLPPLHHQPIPLDLEDSAAAAAAAAASDPWQMLRRRRRRHRTMILNTALLLAATLFIALAAISASTTSGPPSRYHAAFLTAACNATAADHLRHLTARPHVASTPDAAATADYVRSAFTAYGLPVHTSDYSVLLSFPVHRNLSLLSPNGSVLHQLQPPPGTPGMQIISPFHAYSPSGEAEGEVVFANYGREEDFQALREAGVGVTGSIVLARYGQVYRGDIVENAARAGAAAVVVYSDPADYAGNGSYYPESRWLPPGGVQRGTVLQGSGDPGTPGWASVAGGERLRASEMKLPLIPSMPISARDAEPILRGLSGAAGPAGWQGGFAGAVYRFGPGAVRLRFRYTANQTVSVIRNVFAVIQGFEEPDRLVLLGNHRDAWTFGAVDPSSGTAALLEMAHRLGRLLKSGWKPRRSIVLCSWDAEEFGMIGSTEWVEQNLVLLGSRAVAYLNVDCAVSGPGFHAGATPQLDDLLVDIARKVKDPDAPSGSVYDSWVSGDSAPLIDRLGSTGSDYVAFLHHAGVPAVDMYFGKSYPVYHSLYDNYDWMKRFGDPYFSRHVAASSIWGLMALRLADCLVLPFNYTSYATELQAYVKTVEAALLASEAPGNVSASPLQSSVDEFVKSAAHVADESQRLGREASLVLQRRGLNDRLMQAERAFLEEGGLIGRGWYKHLVYGPSRKNKYGTAAFPGIVDAIEGALRSGNESEWRGVQHQIWRVSRVVARATLVLRGELT